jgi:PKD repeat protein
MLKTITRILLLATVALIFSNCKKDEPKPAPVANFSVTGDNKPAPSEVFFSNSSTNATSFLWEFGDGTSSTDKDTKHLYSGSGSFIVKLTAIGEGGTHSITKSITITNPAPVAVFTISGDYNPPPCEVFFSNASVNATSYLWEFGDGGASTEKDTKHTYTSSGNYNVKLTAIGVGGTNSSIQTVTVLKAAPVAGFTFGGNINPAPCEVNFVNTSVDATSYLWEFGDGTTSTQVNPSHIYTQGGAFNAKLTASNESGSTSITKLVTIQNTAFSTTVTFNNPVFTDIYVTMGGTTKIIPSKSSATFYGVSGTSISYYAYTQGTTGSGELIGLTIEWSNIINLTGGNINYTLNVSNDYFFLFLRNSGSYPLTPLYVNYGLASETVDYILIPNDYVNYSIGYYRAFTNTSVRAYYEYLPSNYTYWNSLGFSWSLNQYIELTNSFKSPTLTGAAPKSSKTAKAVLPANENLFKRAGFDKSSISVESK